jgi:hypothetical protein
MMEEGATADFRPMLHGERCRACDAGLDQAFDGGIQDA